MNGRIQFTTGQVIVATGILLGEHGWVHYTDAARVRFSAPSHVIACIEWAAI